MRMKCSLSFCALLVVVAVGMLSGPGAVSEDGLAGVVAVGGLDPCDTPKKLDLSCKDTPGGSGSTDCSGSQTIPNQDGTRKMLLRKIEVTDACPDPDCDLENVKQQTFDEPCEPQGS